MLPVAASWTSLTRCHRSGCQGVPAVRVAAFGAALGCEVELEPHLYDSSANTLLEAAVAAGTEARAHTIMLVAHNPGITDLASRLSAGGIEHMPTCAVARFVWATDDWREAVTRSPDSWSLDTVR